MIADLSYEEQQEFLSLAARILRALPEPVDDATQAALSGVAAAELWAVVESFPPGRRWAAAEGIVQALVIELVSLKQTSLRLLRRPPMVPSRPAPWWQALRRALTRTP